MNGIYFKAIKTFGEANQRRMAIEEMSELTKELCKWERGEDNWQAIAEEIADVEITLRQVKMMFNCEQEVQKIKGYKLLRLSQRIKEELASRGLF